MDACVETATAGVHSRQQSESMEVDALSRIFNKDQKQKLSLEYCAKCANKLLTPVIICALFVVANIKYSNFDAKKDVLPFHKLSADTPIKLWYALANSIVLLIVIIVMTIFMVFMYLKRCFKFLSAWLILATFIMLFVLSYFHFSAVLSAYNIPMDCATALLIIWNFGIVGMLVIHWQGPIHLQQGYLIYVAALMALIFIKYLTDWATWFLLIGVSIWDLFAVMKTKGPLRLLVEAAQQRNEQMLPALIYSSTVVYMYTAIETPNLSATIESNVCQTTKNTSLKRRRDGTKVILTAQTTSVVNGQSTEVDHMQNLSQKEFQKSIDIKLGLGDLIFYAVLLGKVSILGNWSTMFACLLSILVGLFLTLLLLMMWRKILPALPISIAFGLIFYFTLKLFVEPFIENMLDTNVFI